MLTCLTLLGALFGYAIAKAQDNRSAKRLREIQAAQGHRRAASGWLDWVNQQDADEEPD